MAYSLLMHTIEIDDYNDDIKYIGVYETEDEAYDTIDVLIDKPGFKDYPDGFYVSNYPIGDIFWEDGFVTE